MLYNDQNWEFVNKSIFCWLHLNWVVLDKGSLNRLLCVVFFAFSSFLLPFDTRLLVFFATAMDRDRALQHLQDLMNEGGAGNAALSVLTPDNVQRSITPRLERRKARFKHCYFTQLTALLCERGTG